uniref:Tumor protein D52 n=1 Tax=Canis lupus familiaris TaxID=9615 RepID=A0A8C0N4I4_CANLF
MGSPQTHSQFGEPAASAKSESGPFALRSPGSAAGGAGRGGGGGAAPRVGAAFPSAPPPAPRGRCPPSTGERPRRPPRKLWGHQHLEGPPRGARPLPPRRGAPPPPPPPTWRGAQVGRVRWLGAAPGKRSPPRAGAAAAPHAAGGGDSRESRAEARSGAPGGGAEDARRRAGRSHGPRRASGNLSPSGSPTLQKFGLLRTDPVPEEGEDVVATIGATETLSEEEQEELRRELAKVEEEIQTLSQVLAAKEKHLAEIKRKLGINSLQELKQNIAKGWQDVTATSAYKKTSETLSQAGQKASAAFSSVGSVITKKLEDVNIRSIQHSISMPAMRNSPTFKSFEEKVENLKSKVGGTKPAGGDFGEVLNSTANASATAPEPLPEQTQASP